MAKEFRLPDVGEGVAEGEVTKWLVQEGDRVKENQPLVEVMTDKVTVELPSPFTGKVLKLYAKVGDVVKVGAPLVAIGEEGEAVETAPPPAPAHTAEAPPPKPASPGGIGAETPATPGQVLATPAVRRVARELSVDLAHVRGTGPGGRITEEDVRSFSPAKPAAPAVAIIEGEERIPLRGMRKRIADKMSKSRHTAAHFTYVEEVDATALVGLRDQLKAEAEKHGAKLTYLPFIMRAVVQGLKEFPYLNATLDEERQEIVLKKEYNLGMAAATDEGLIVPVVKHADQKDIYQLAKDVETLAEKARASKLALDEIQGSTFSITSLGALGGLFATPIINYPEVAILGVHRIQKRPVVHNNHIAVRDIMLISLSFDHRVIDGHVGAAFANRIKELLEHPALLFLGAK